MQMNQRKMSTNKIDAVFLSVLPTQPLHMHSLRG